MTRWLPSLAGLLVHCAGSTVTYPAARHEAPASPGPASAAHPAASARERLLLIAAGAPCLPGEQAIHAQAMAGVDAVRDTLGPLFGKPPRPVEDPSVAELVAAVQHLPLQPSLTLYAGHGVLLQLDGDAALSEADLAELRRGRRATIPLPSGVVASVTGQCNDELGRCVSAVCLKDGWITVNEIVTAIPQRSEGSLLVMDSCASAHVDVRSTTSVAVISGSPFSYPTQGKQTQLAAALATLEPETLDADCNGWIEPQDIFRRLRLHLFHRHSNTAPKLRSQLPQPLRLSPAPKARACRALPASPVPPPLAHCSWEDRMLEVHVQGPLTIATELDASCNGLHMGAPEMLGSPRLIPVACKHDEGQCFRTQEQVEGER